MRELLHGAMRPGHSTSVCLVQAVPIPLLERVVVRAVEVRRGRVEAVRTVRGVSHDGMGATGFLLLEVGPVAERSVNHAMYCECVDELRSDADWAAWARRMELCAGATIAEHSADGGPAMIRRAVAVEVADVPDASLPPCAECDGGRVRASGSTSTWRSGEPIGIEVAGGCARGTRLAAHVALVGAFGLKAGGQRWDWDGKTARPQAALVEKDDHGASTLDGVGLPPPPEGVLHGLRQSGLISRQRPPAVRVLRTVLPHGR